MGFQLYTGAQCNVVPLHVYIKATGETVVTQVALYRLLWWCKKPIDGQVLILTSRGYVRCTLNCDIIDGPMAHRLLGYKACLGMGLVCILDTAGVTVCAVRIMRTLTNAQIIRKCPVFSGTAGRLDGEYYIKLDPPVISIQHALHHIQVTMGQGQEYPGVACAARWVCIYQ